MTSFGESGLAGKIFHDLRGEPTLFIEEQDELRKERKEFATAYEAMKADTACSTTAQAPRDKQGGLKASGSSSSSEYENRLRNKLYRKRADLQGQLQEITQVLDILLDENVRKVLRVISIAEM